MSNAALTRPQQFWQTHAKPNIGEFRRNTADQRKAMNAALSAFHMHDYVWETYHESAPAKIFQQTARPYDFALYLIENECREFNLIRDLANAHKHMKLKRNPTRIIASAQAMFSERPGSSFFSSWFPTTEIMVELENGREVRFAPALEKVVQMWERLIRNPGL